MGEPVVVQGTAISQPYNPYEHKAAAPTDQPVAQQPASSSGAGEAQPTKCRDPIFALLLIGNVAAICAVAGIYGSTAFDQNQNTSGENYDGYVVAAFVLGAIAMVFTGFCLPIMMCIPMILIKASLIGMLILSGAMMVVSFLSGNIIGGIFGVVFFLIFACYARAGTFLIHAIKRELECCTIHHELTFFSSIMFHQFGLVYHLPVSTCLPRALR